MIYQALSVRPTGNPAFVAHRMEQLREKLREYRTRDSGKDSVCKSIILAAVLAASARGAVFITSDELQKEFVYAGHTDFFGSEEYHNACGVIQKYVGGDEHRILGGIGLPAVTTKKPPKEPFEGATMSALFRADMQEGNLRKALRLALKRHGPLAVASIVSVSGVSREEVMRHVMALVCAGVVSVNESGNGAIAFRRAPKK